MIENCGGQTPDSARNSSMMTPNDLFTILVVTVAAQSFDIGVSARFSLTIIRGGTKK